jgi:hypothetical protein
MKTKVVSSFFGLVLSLATVQAATVTYSTNSGVITPLTSALPVAGSLALPQFDPSLGTLNSVSFLFRSTLTGSNTVGNFSGGTMTFLLTATASNVFDVPGASGVGVINNSLPQSALNVPDGDSSVLTGGTFADATYNVVGSLLPFTGLGSFNVDYSSLPLFSLTTIPEAGQISTDFNYSLLEFAEVTYDFERIPEPASAIALLGALGAAVTRRKRQA